MAKPFTILVTGGGGYIGSHAVLALRDAGWPVAVIDNLTTGFRWAVPEDVAFYEGDIEDSALLAQIGRRSAQILSQQQRQKPQPDRIGSEGRGPAFHFLVDRCHLWHS